MGRFVHVLSVGRRIDEAERVASYRAPMYDRRSVREPIIGSLSGIGAAAIAALGAGLGGSPAGFGAEPQSEPVEALELPQDLVQSLIPDIQSTLSEVEDNRMFNPDETRSLRRVSTKPIRRLSVATSKAMPLGYAYAVPWGLRADAKSSVIMCIRRHARRGVILALGQGGGYHRPPRRNSTSDVWC